MTEMIKTIDEYKPGKKRPNIIWYILFHRYTQKDVVEEFRVDDTLLRKINREEMKNDR